MQMNLVRPSCIKKSRIAPSMVRLRCVLTSSQIFVQLFELWIRQETDEQARLVKKLARRR